MIHYISIPAADPGHVARVLTELFEGVLTGFGPHHDSYIAWAGDEHGTAIEVYPLGTEMFPHPGAGQAQFRMTSASPFGPVHAAVSVHRSREQIFALAQREGWRAVELPRGPNNVIEFWVENAVMLELMTPDMAADYVRGADRLRALARGGAGVR